MKTRKWQALLNSKSYLNCKGTNEGRNFRVFKIGSQWSLEPGVLVNTNTRTIDGSDVPYVCLLYTSPSPRDGRISRMPSSA